MAYFPIPEFLDKRAMQKRGDWKREFNNLINDVLRRWEVKVTNHLQMRLSKGTLNLPPLSPTTKKWRDRVVKEGKSTLSAQITKSRPILIVSGRMLQGIRVKVNKMTYDFEVMSTAKPIYYTGKMANRRRKGSASQFNYGKELNKSRPFLNIPRTWMPPNGKQWIKILQDPSIDFNRKLMRIIRDGELQNYKSGVVKVDIDFPGKQKI
tara:strand:+ start:1391 stop:2014 length:624 start_codon:yes stop_codon:yes gene_type:complete